MLAFFIALAVLSCAQAARGSTQDKRNIGTPLTFYIDRDCATPSSITPNVTLGLNVCVVTTGLQSLVITPTACTIGNVGVWSFSDVACGKVGSWYRTSNHCFSTYGGSMAAIMLTCDANKDETTPSRPTSTTSIAVAPVADAATATAGGSKATGTSPSTSNSSATSTSGTEDASTTNSNSKGWWNSLDPGARIGIIVAIAVGVPPILIGLYTLQVMKKKKQRKMEQANRGYGYS